MNKVNQSHESSVIKLAIYAKMPTKSLCSIALISISNKPDDEHWILSDRKSFSRFTVIDGKKKLLFPS